MKRLSYLAFLLLAVLALTAVACGDDDDDDDDATATSTGTATGTATATTAPLDESNPFRVAVFANVTGPFAPFEGTNVDGFETAVNLINETGGVLGRKMEFEVFDGRSDFAAMAEVVNEALLSGDTFHAIYAGSFSMLFARQPIVEAGLLTLSNSGDPDVPDPTVNVCPGGCFDHAAAPALQAETVACMLNQLDHHSYAIFEVEAAFSDVQVEVMQEALPALGMEVTGVEVVQRGTPDVSAQMAKLKATNPDALYLEVGANDLAFALDAIENIDWDVPIVGGIVFSSTDFTNILEDPATDIPAGTIMAAWDLNVQRPEGGLTENQQFAIEKLKEAGFEVTAPLYNYGFGWDAAYLMKYAAETAGSDDSAAMTTALEGLGAVQDQSGIGTILKQYGITPEFHGDPTVPITSAIAAPSVDGVFQYGGFEIEFPCREGWRAR